MNVSPIEVDRRDAMSKYGVNTKSSDIRKKLRFNHAPCIFYTKKERKIWELIKKGALNLWTESSDFCVNTAVYTWVVYDRRQWLVFIIDVQLLIN